MHQGEGAPIAAVGRHEDSTVVHRAARDQHQYHDDDSDRPAPTDVSPSMRRQIALCVSRWMKHPSLGQANTCVRTQISFPRCTVVATRARMRRKWHGDQRNSGRSTTAVSSNTKSPRSSTQRSTSEPTRNAPLRGRSPCSCAGRSAHCVDISVGDSPSSSSRVNIKGAKLCMPTSLAPQAKMSGSVLRASGHGEWSVET
jgi:hypothetical protein